MKGELIINGKDAWETWGVSMGNGFLDAMDAFVYLKEYIENDSMTQHGKEVLIVPDLLKVASRELTLHFTIKGQDSADFRKKRAAFEQELLKGEVKVKVPVLGSQVYRLIYLGRSVSYDMNFMRTFCALSLKFEEPNPMNRAESV